MKALTANRLADGEVVFWANGAWVEHFGRAEIFVDDPAAEAVEIAARAAITQAVDPYLIEVQPVDQGYAPVSYRERLRALGPTNKREHGKQASGGAEVDLLNRAHGLIKRK
jgi:hypothetical protein